MKKSNFLLIAIDAAKKAEEVILSHYNSVIDYATKADMSPVTIADKEAESVIIQTIKAAYPNHSFIGEESGRQESNSKYQWIIDPIDGTKNYTRHIPLFATQIALLRDGEVILGVSNAPALKELIYAEKGKGAYLNEENLTVSNLAKLSDSYLCFGGIKYFKKHSYIDALLNLANKTLGHRGIGDFWCYHLLAQGKIDIMIEAQTKIWDFAALKIIVEEAGGKVTDIKGNPITIDTTSIVATNKKLHNSVVTKLNTAV